MTNFSACKAILVAISLSLGEHAQAFTNSPLGVRHCISALHMPTNDSCKSTSPFVVHTAPSKTTTNLFVAVDLDDPAIRSLEKEMKALEARKEKASLKVTKVEEKLQSLQKKKQDYLEGMKLGVSAEKNFSETTVRSAVKAFMWRIIAGSVTFFTSLRFSGSVSNALKIVGSDFFSKSLTMFIGERLMNKSKAGRKGGADDIGRSLVKALIWRAFAIVNTLTMSYVIAKDLSMASKIAGSDAVFKTGLMFFYERVWAKIEWGKEYSVEFSI